jgi:YVTN family beta-propeller protein
VGAGCTVGAGGEIALEFRILGPVEAADEHGSLALGGPKQRALLAILLLRRGEVLSSDRLIDALWGERAPATATKTLQGYVSHLRKALGDGVLVTRGGGYVLAVEAEQVDAGRFAALVAQARGARGEGDPARARELLERALALWRGEALGDLAYEPFAAGEVARLEEARVCAQEDRVEADLLLGRHREVVSELEPLVRAHPHRERLLGELMLALYRSGRQTEALEVYRRGRRALRDELGLEPGAELRALEQRIIAQDPALDAPAVRPVRGPVARPARPVRGRTLALAGGALLALAAIAAALVALVGGGGTTLTAAPNSVAAIDTRTDAVVGDVPVGARPGALALGAGSLWVANVDDQTVSRVDPATLETQRTLPLGGPPTGMAVAGGGLWVVAADSSATSVPVSRIDPQFDTVDRTVRVGNVVLGSPGALAAQGATLWVAPSSGELERLDPATGRALSQIDPNASPAGIALGAGAAWVTDSTAGDVTRVDPTGVISTVAVGHGASGIAVGEGGVWVANTGDDAVVRIDPDTRAVTTTIPVGAAPTGVAVGAGSVWVANSGDGTVSRIDPRRERVSATIRVGGSPQAIAVAGRRAWVTVDAPAIPPTGLPAAGGTARVDAAQDVDSLDPALAYEPDSWQILYATCAKLLNYPDQSGQRGSVLAPEVAQSLPARSPDGLAYTFAIRSGFRFSPPSGAPVTAQTFKDTIERTLNPKMRNPVAGEFADIVGARAFMSGRASHIAGVVARASTLTIRLTAPHPDLPSRLAQPFFCAVPSDTPIDPKGERVIPSAGPYTVASYTPGQGIALIRNPNYHGARPHRLARIDVALGIPSRRAVAQVQAGGADYATDGEIGAAQDPVLAARDGAGSPAARAGHQQYFVTAVPEVDSLALNTHRALFADARLREAVSDAVNRSALARIGDLYTNLPEHPTVDDLPPGVPGYSDVHAYPLTPDVPRARALAAGHAGQTAVLYTCARPECAQNAQIVRTDLAAIGLRVVVKTFADAALFARLVTPGEPFDLAPFGWDADYPDPFAVLNVQLEDPANLPTFADARYAARLAAASELSGSERLLAYARLDADLVRDAVPLVAYGNASRHELFSARMGCQTYGFYGLDLAALCVRGR